MLIQHDHAAQIGNTSDVACMESHNSTTNVERDAHKKSSRTRIRSRVERRRRSVRRRATNRDRDLDRTDPPPPSTPSSSRRIDPKRIRDSHASSDNTRCLNESVNAKRGSPSSDVTRVDSSREPRFNRTPGSSGWTRLVPYTKSALLGRENQCVVDRPTWRRASRGSVWKR